MINRITIIATFWLLIACNENANNNDVIEDTSAPLDEYGVTQTSYEFHLLFPELALFFEQQDTSFHAAHFADPGTIDRDTSLLLSSPLNAEQSKPFETLLIYNEDKTQAIDLYSYNYIENRRSGKTKWERGEPDTEVTLIDFHTKTRKRIFYTGPSYEVLDAKWIGRDTIALAIAAIVEEQTIQPALINLDLRNNRQEMIEYTDTLRVDINQYIEKKMQRSKTILSF